MKYEYRIRTNGNVYRIQRRYKLRIIQRLIPWATREKYRWGYDEYEMQNFDSYEDAQERLDDLIEAQQEMEIRRSNNWKTV